MPFFYIVPFVGDKHVKIGVAVDWETRIDRLGAHLFERGRACTVATHLIETARTIEGLFKLAFGAHQDPYADEAEGMNGGYTEIYRAKAWPDMLKLAESIVDGWPNRRLRLWRAPGLDAHPPGTAKPRKLIPFPEPPRPRPPIRKRRSAGFLYVERSA
jgi:hypothetical protein